MQSESFHGAEEEFDDDDDDDETASMSSYSTNPSLSSSLDSYQQQQEQPQRRQEVSFHPQLVTAVYTRPTTTPREKYHLHYSDWDYVDFRVDWACGKDRATKRVQFHLEDVTAIHTIPTATRPDPSSSLYYSKQELQGFLDDFVQSLYTDMDMETDYST